MIYIKRILWLIGYIPHTIIAFFLLLLAFLAYLICCIFCYIKTGDFDGAPEWPLNLVVKWLMLYEEMGETDEDE